MEKVTIQITKTFEITKAERSLIVDLRKGKRITAIKFLFGQYGLSLAEAKSICEAVWEAP